MGGFSKGGKESGTARIVGSGTAGILELLMFHPVDTVAKRLMNNQQKVFVSGQPFSQGLSQLNSVVFKTKEAANQPLMKRYMSLFTGVNFAFGYKIMQRVYKFGGQPFVNEHLAKNSSETFKALFGERNAKSVMHATAGSLIGIGEIVLLPLDVLKIKMQTNPQFLKGRGLLRIIRDEGMGLYRGATWTAARNAPGSFALFGGSALAKEYLFQLQDYGSATFAQNFVASIAGAVASLTVSAPLDVVKTRIQAARFDSSTSGWTILSNMIKKEGLGSLFKGLTPKILVVGPKIIFSFTVAQQLIPRIDSLLKKENAIAA